MGLVIRLMLTLVQPRSQTPPLRPSSPPSVPSPVYCAAATGSDIWQAMVISIVVMRKGMMMWMMAHEKESQGEGEEDEGIHDVCRHMTCLFARELVTVCVCVSRQ